MIIVTYMYLCNLVICAIVSVLNSTLYHSRWECVRLFIGNYYYYYYYYYSLCDLCIKGDIFV